MMRFVFVLAFLSVAWGSNLQLRKNRIVGGTPVPIEMYPFMASMEITWIPGWYGSFCGGSLITRSAVLSAAHCYNLLIDFGETARIRVRLGVTRNEQGGSLHTVSRIIMHENFVPILWRSDIAIVRLAIAATLSNQIGIARIAGPNYSLHDNMRLYVAGWGAIASGGPSSEVLLHTFVHVINHDLCTARYAELRKRPGFENMAEVTPSMLCTGILNVGGQDACQGDSGGPVVHQGDIVVGVTSWGYECAHPEFPGVNARVPHYTQWISTNAVA